MKKCKRCSCNLSLLQGNYCEECKDHLTLREKLKEEGWNTTPFPKSNFLVQDGGEKQ